MFEDGKEHTGLPYEFKTVDFSNFVTYLFGHEHCMESILFKHLQLIKFDLSKYPVCIAGGSVRDIFLGKPASDIDIYSTIDGSDYWLDTIAKSENTLMGMNMIPKLELTPIDSYALTKYYQSTYYLSEVIKVQFVRSSLPNNRDKTISGTPKTILENFDFTINQFAFHGNNHLTYNVLGMSDLLTRTLRLVSFKNLNNSVFNKSMLINRVNKFVRMGFKLDRNTANFIFKDAL